MFRQVFGADVSDLFLRTRFEPVSRAFAAFEENGASVHFKQAGVEDRQRQEDAVKEASVDNKSTGPTPEDIRRERILEAACRLFPHYGAKKTTVADIAAEAGVGTGSVYLEFSSKTAIVHALSEQALETVLQAMDAAIAAPGTIEERLARALTARYEAFVAVAGQGAHATELLHCSSAPIQKTWAAFAAAQHHLLAQVIAADDGSLAGRCGVITDATEAAQALLNAYAAFAPPLVDTSQSGANLAQLATLHRWVLGVGIDCDRTPES